MIETLIGKLLDFIQWWAWWYIQQDYELGFVRRFGVVRRSTRPGLNLKLPFIEQGEAYDARDGVLLCQPQSLRTQDGIDVVIRLALPYRITDAIAYATRSEDGTDNIQDVAMAEMADYVAGHDLAAVPGALLEVRRRTRAQARKWGVEVADVRLIDFCRAKSLRLWSGLTNEIV